MAIANKSKRKFRKWGFSYQWIVRNVPYFLFLAVLAILYIYNGHYSDNTIKDISKIGREIKELQYEYKTLKSEVMLQSKQSELVKAVEPLGLKPLTEPPFVLTDTITEQP